jgi:tetratricopeptide (TPR) repeat protein
MPGLASKMSPGLPGLGTSNYINNRSFIQPLRENYMFEFSNIMLNTQTTITKKQNDIYDRESVFCNLVVSENCNMTDWIPCTPRLSCCTTQGNTIPQFMFEFDEHSHEYGHTHYLPIDDFDHHVKINEKEHYLETTFEEVQRKDMIDIETKKSTILGNINNNIHHVALELDHHDISNKLLDHSDHLIEDYQEVLNKVNDLSNKTMRFKELVNSLNKSLDNHEIDTLIQTITDEFNMKEQAMKSTIATYEELLSSNEDIIHNLKQEIKVLTGRILEMDNLGDKTVLLDKIDRLEEVIDALKKTDSENILIINDYKTRLENERTFNQEEIDKLVKSYEDEILNIKNSNMQEHNSVIEENKKQLKEQEQLYIKRRTDIITHYEEKIQILQGEFKKEKEDTEKLLQDKMIELSNSTQEVSNLEKEHKEKLNEKEAQFNIEKNNLINHYKELIDTNKNTFNKEKNDIIADYKNRLSEQESRHKKAIEDLKKQYEQNVSPASFISFRIYNENILDPTIVSSLKNHITFIQTFLNDIITTAPRKINILLVIRKLNDNELGAADWLNHMILLNETYLNPNNLPQGWDSLMLNNNKCNIVAQTLLHEVLHILGIGVGNVWDSLVTNAPDNSRKVYIGKQGVKQYNDFFKHFNTEYKFIPLEDDFGPGTKDSHFEEGDIYGGVSEKIVNGEIYPYLSNEIMTGFLNFSNLFTVLCAGVLEDLGYDINYSSKNIIKSTTNEAYLLSLTNNKMINSRLY